MASTISIQGAQAHLAELIAELAPGDELVITRMRSKRGLEAPGGGSQASSQGCESILQYWSGRPVCASTATVEYDPACEAGYLPGRTVRTNQRTAWNAVVLVLAAGRSRPLPRHKLRSKPNRRPQR